MNKARLETLVDSLFAIIMTLLVFSIQMPSGFRTMDDMQILSALSALTPTFFAYVLTFGTLTSYWMSHHMLITVFTKNINRQLIMLNIFFLMFLSILPFSATLVGAHSTSYVAIIVYGINNIFIILSLLAIRLYVLRSPHIENEETTPERLRQSLIRICMPLFFIVIGLIMGGVDRHLALLFFTLPVLYTFTPGSIRRTDRYIQRLCGHSVR